MVTEAQTQCESFSQAMIDDLILQLTDAQQSLARSQEQAMAMQTRQSDITSLLESQAFTIQALELRISSSKAKKAHLKVQLDEINARTLEDKDVQCSIVDPEQIISKIEILQAAKDSLSTINKSHKEEIERVLALNASLSDEQRQIRDRISTCLV